jgi:phage tail tube protein FII
MHNVIDRESADSMSRKFLVAALALALAFALGCDGDDAHLVNDRDAEQGGEQDASLEDPWDDSVGPGCSAMDEAVDELPQSVDGIGSPRTVAEKVTGTWTNADGDSITVELATAGRLHIVDGMATGNGSTAASQCSAYSYAAVDATVTLVTSDGSFDEVLEGGIRIRGMSASLHINMWLEDVEGSFTAASSQDGVLKWYAKFPYAGNEAWGFVGVINGDERVVALPVFDQ